MPEETIRLTNKQQALLMRCCKHDSLTPSEFFNAALRRELEIKSPITKLITRKGAMK